MGRAMGLGQHWDLPVWGAGGRKKRCLLHFAPLWSLRSPHRAGMQVPLAGNDGSGGESRRSSKVNLSRQPQQQTAMSAFTGCSVEPWWCHSMEDASWMLLSADDT